MWPASLASQGEGLVGQSGPTAVHSPGLLDREVRGPPDISVVEPSCISYLYYTTVQFCSSEKDSESESGHFTWVMVVFIQNAKIKNLTARLDRSIEGQSESGGEESQENYAIVTR